VKTTPRSVHESTAMELNLVLLLMELIAAIGQARGGKATSDCCYKKVFKGANYTIHESGSSEVEAYGCDTAGSCVYTNDETGERFCFKMGGMEQPTCDPGPPGPCNGIELIATVESGKPFKANVLPGDNCIPPAFPEPPEPGLTFSHLYSCNNIVYTKGAKSSGNEQLYVLKNSTTWSKVETPAGLPEPPYEDELSIAAAKDKLYLVGGATYDSKWGIWEGANTIWEFDCVKHAKGGNTNGGAWRKLDLKLSREHYGGKACITGDTLVSVGGKDVSVREPRRYLDVYNLADSNSRAKKMDLSDSPYVKTLTCAKDKIYLTYDSSCNCASASTTFEVNLNKDPLSKEAVKQTGHEDIGSTAFYNENLIMMGGKTLLVLQEDGNWVPTHNFTWNTGSTKFQGIVRTPISYP